MFIDSACYWVGPIITNEEERQHLRESTRRTLLTHNNAWVSNCPKEYKQYIDSRAVTKPAN